LTRPKPLLPVANRPLLAYHLDALAPLVDTVCLVVGYKQAMIREALGDAWGDLALEYVEQTEQRGTGHALLQCAGRMDEPFLALNGDDLWDAGDLARLAEAPCGVLVKSVADPRQYGVFEVDRDHNVQRLVEKPADPATDLANMGLYKFDPAIFPLLEATAPSERGEIEITSAVQALAERRAVRAVAAEGPWIAIGYPWQLLDANTHVLDTQLPSQNFGQVSPLAEINGAVSIGRGSVVRPGVVIDGPVLIGEECVIGPNCFIRAHTSVGKGCKIGQGCEVKNSILMDKAKVPHLSYVGDSVVGAGANLGCGTVISNFRHDGGNHRSMVKGELIDTGRRKLGAIIGDGVHTGINTSIYPGRKLWPHTSTRPGAVIQEDITE